MKGIQWLCKGSADVSMSEDILVIRQCKNLDLILFLLTDPDPVKTNHLIGISVKNIPLFTF